MCQTIETDVIHLGDCLEGMKQLPDKCIDLIVTDPPYQECSRSGAGMFGYKNRAYRSEIKDLTHGITNDILEEMYRVMKVPNIYIWCNKNQLRQYLDFFEDKGCTSDLLCWHKTNPTPAINNSYLPDTEYCLLFRGKGATLYGDYDSKHKYWLSPTNKEDKKKYMHPTVKPINIIRTLISNSSKEGDVVLDPFMGSGTTAAACMELKRHYIGYEINPLYHKMATERVSTKASHNLLDYI